MEDRIRRKTPLTLALSGLLAGLALTSCFNGAEHGIRNHGVIGVTGGRFALVIESDRTDLGATHFLVDTATGDLWSLRQQEAGAEWQRVAEGPKDAKPLRVEQILGELMEGPAETVDSALEN